MTDRKKKDKKSKKAARTQSCLQQDSPALPPRPPGGLPSRVRTSFAFDRNTLSASLPTGSPAFAMDTDTPPPLPTTPRPKFHITKTPAPLPPPDDAPPPLPPPLVSPIHSKSPARQRSVPATPPPGPTPTTPSSPDPRYVKPSLPTPITSATPGATPSINANTVLSEEQLRAQIEMQTQNTEELRELLKGREDETMTPVVLAGKYGKYFPFKVTVMKGFYNNRAEIVAGEIYNVHFLKNARVIAISDSSGQKYVLPLNAAMRIGFEQPHQPSIYYNIIDIINSTAPPKLISPREDYHGNEGNSLQRDEVLVVRGVHVSRVRRTKSLQVMNVKTSEEKKIPSDCPVQFSTEPMYTQLTLSDAVHKMPELIPGHARLYPTVEVEDMGFPSHLVSETVKVRRQYVERSLITTLEDQEPRPVDRFSLSTEPIQPIKTIYDLPLSLDIEFSIIPPEPEEDLYAYTHQLCQQFDPRKLQSGDGLGLNMALDEDNIYSGVELELPPYINYDPTAPTFEPTPGLQMSTAPPPLPARRPSDKEEEDYTEIDPHLESSFMSSRPPPLPTSLPPTSRPSSASRPSLPPRSSPPQTSPRPAKRTQQEHAPLPKPSPRKQDSTVSLTSEADEYVDVDEQFGAAHTQDPPPPSSTPSSSLPHSRPPYKYPLVKIPTSSAPTPSTITDSAPSSTPPSAPSSAPPSAPPSAPSSAPSSAPPSLPPLTPLTVSTELRVSSERGRERSPLSPASSGGSAYDDTADLLGGLRPRLPSPTTVCDSEDDHEIMQQFSELLSVVQSARSLAKSRLQQSSPAHTTAELKRLRDDLKKVSAFPQKIITHCMVLERELSSLKDVVKEEIVKTSSSEAVEENRQFLESLTVAQTITMLDRMNMKKYQDKFAQEGIDGSILMDIEETTLETELGVTSKLDRVKLMKIIRGERSAKSVLEGQYNYVSLHVQPL